MIMREHITKALNGTGINWRYGGNVSHWGVFPENNLKPWTPEEQSILESAVKAIGGRITNKMVEPDFSSYTASDGYGFRVWTATGDELK